MPRISALDKFVGLRELVATMLAEGLAYGEIQRALAASEYPVAPGLRSVERWVHDGGVRERLAGIMLDRVVQISRIIDRRIAERLDREADTMDLGELLAIRREFAPAAEAFDDTMPTRGELTRELFGDTDTDDD